MSTFVNNLQLTSADITLTIKCGDNLLSEISTPINPTYLSHGTTNGFILPMY